MMLSNHSKPQSRAHTVQLRLGLVILVFTFLLNPIAVLADDGARPTGPFQLFLPTVANVIPPEWIGPTGGLIASVAISPSQPDILYAGSWGGGVYKSLDRGQTWEWTSQGIQNLTIVSLAVDPLDPQVAYAGTYRGKLYKTIDGGQSWTLSSEGVQEGAIVYSIVVDPKDPQTVYMATRGLSNHDQPPWNGVIYRSRNAGANWQAVLQNLGGRSDQDWAYMLAVHPRSTGILFAATHEHGMLISDDQGDSWEEINEGITNLSTRAVVVGPTRDTADVVYTAVWEKRGAFRSEDLGQTWELLDNGSAGAQIYGMDINPVQPQVLYLASYNMGVLMTSNEGRRWSPAGLTSYSIPTVRVHPTDTQTVFAGTTEAGLYASHDGGETWGPSQVGMDASAATALVVSPLNPSELYAGTTGQGVMRSSDGGATWEGFNQNLGDRLVNTLVLHPTRSWLYALTQQAGLYRLDLQNPGAGWQRTAVSAMSTAGGPAQAIRPLSSQASFEAAFPEASLAPQEAAVFPGSGGPLALVFAPSQPDLAYLGQTRGGVLRSEDGGRTWVNAGLSGQTVWGLAVDPANPLHVAAATSQEGGIQVSLDGGRTWVAVSQPTVSVYSLAFSPTVPGVLFAAGSGGVYRLEAGAWQVVGLENQVVSRLAFSPSDPSTLIAGTTAGAFVSRDGGQTWKPGPAELAGHTVQEINFNPTDPGQVYFSTTNHGVLRAEGY